MVSVYKIPKIIELMYRFQEENNITGACVSNCQYLYDNLKQVIDVKAHAVIVYIPKEKRLCTGHIVLKWDDTIIEPSYYYKKSIKDSIYYFKWKDFIDNVSIKNKKHNMTKSILKNFIHFQGIANKMNNGELCISCKNTYHKQADYIEDKL